MAKRKYFYSDTSSINPIKEELAEFQYYNGFAVSQKQKCIKSFHEAIRKNHPDMDVLEISTKSMQELGVWLSAFNLKLYSEAYDRSFTLENVFQSSKVFTDGGPYEELLFVSPVEAKKDERIRTSGNLIGFRYESVNYPIEPKTLFYDWIYVNAINQNHDLSERILEYDCFTDIEFNPEKSLNCQARAAAMFVGLSRQGIIEEALSGIEKFKGFYEFTETEEQLAFIP